MQQLSLQSVRLWQFNLATFIASQILFGVEGWPAWAISAAVAWATTRGQPLGEKNYLLAAIVWAFFAYLALGQRYDWY